MKVGFIGLGRMGGHMCSNVIKAGFETYVSDLVPALVEQKVAEGAIGCKDNLEVAANMDIGFTMLPNGAIVEAVMCGPKGVLSHASPAPSSLTCPPSLPAPPRRWRRSPPSTA